jgi:ArsR family transcriptional regulator, virulence genes transcriptional regulator
MAKDIYRLHAEVCKTLSHAKRLEILDILRQEEMSVGVIVKKMKVSKANVSQHLAILRKAGILKTRREGLTIFYCISSAKVTRACDLMREVLLEQHAKKDSLLKQLK